MQLTSECEMQLLLSSRLHSNVMQLTAECRGGFLLSPVLHLKTAQAHLARLDQRKAPHRVEVLQT